MASAEEWRTTRPSPAHEVGGIRSNGQAPPPIGGLIKKDWLRRRGRDEFVWRWRPLVDVEDGDSKYGWARAMKTKEKRIVSVAMADIL